MEPFSRLPAAILSQEVLKNFVLPQGVWHLKTLMALVILRGQFERRILKPVEHFPATLAAVAETAHLNRTHAQESLKALMNKNIIERLSALPADLHVAPRTSAYRFVAGDQRFFPVPYARLRESKFLSHLRLRNGPTLAALKIYLILGSFRNNRTGLSSVGYDKFEEFGVPRHDIRGGISLLIASELVHAMPATDLDDGFGHSTRYFILGLGRVPPITKSE